MVAKLHSSSLQHLAFSRSPTPFSHLSGKGEGAGAQSHPAACAQCCCEPEGDGTSHPWAAGSHPEGSLRGLNHSS